MAADDMTTRPTAEQALESFRVWTACLSLRSAHDPVPRPQYPPIDFEQYMAQQAAFRQRQEDRKAAKALAAIATASRVTPWSTLHESANLYQDRELVCVVA